MEPDAGGARELQTAGDRLVLGHRRPRASVGERVGAVARGLLGGDPGADDLVVLGVDSGQPAGRAIAAKARSSWASGIRGKRWGWVSKVESLNAAAPASTRAPTSSIGPRGGTVAHSATSMTASRPTSADLGLERRQRVDRPAGVVGHVDDRRHPARRRRARAQLDALFRHSCGCGRGRRRHPGAGARRRSPGNRRPAHPARPTPGSDRPPPSRRRGEGCRPTGECAPRSSR